MMNETNDCQFFDVFCNNKGTLQVLTYVMQEYSYYRDCVNDWSYAFSSPPPGACVFSPEDMEDYDDADTHTSDYIGV